jgi:ATP-binding cassette, subfamily C, bacterial CydC
MKDLLPFLRLLRRHRRWALLALVCGVVTLLASIGLLAISGWFLSAAALAAASITAAQAFNVFAPSAGIRGCAVVRTAGRYAERIIAHETTLRLLSSLRVWFYRKIEPQAPASLLRQRSGDLLGRIVHDIDTLDGLFIRVLAPSLVAACICGAVCVLLWWLAPQLAWLFLLFFTAAAILVPLLTQHLGHPIGCSIQEQTARARANLVEDLQGMADLLIYGAHARHRRQRLQESRQLLRLQERMSAVTGLGSALLTLLAGLTAVSALYIAIPMIQEGRFAAPLLALIAFGVLAAFEAVTPLPGAWQMLGKTRAAARRILDITAVPADITFTQDDGPRPPHDTIAFHDVSFRYPQSTQQDAVTQIDLCLPQHTSLALVGPSGCGKTTLANLLARFWDPDQGRITIGGIDLRRLSEPRLRGMITVISQKTHIFNMTLRDNLRIAAPDATDEQLMDALARAELAEFVRRLPDGLDTWAGEQGSQMSVGQARRLALARALLKDAPIWILDEPTEGLDNRTGQQFTATLLANLTGKTMLLITHLEQVLGQVDQICFMQKARIVATGPHQALTATCEAYRRFLGRHLM